MDDWIPVAKEEEIPEDEGLGRVAGGHRIALFRLEDGVYALDDVCSHEFSLLSEGEVWEEDVHCVKHGSRFNIKTGAVIGLPATKPVSCHPVKVEDGVVFVKVEAS